MSFVVKDLSTCTVVAPNGHEFPEFSCLYPTLNPIYFDFEKYHEADKHYVFNYVPVQEFLESNWVVPITAVTIYALFCYYGQKYMKNRPAYNFRSAMAVWNLFLSVYSGISALRCFTAFHSLATRSLRDNLCIDPTTVYGGSFFLWTILFVLSKFAELWDTFFIVVHKKPLIFLHWYHHITVLLYCWVAFQEKTPSAVFFGSINAFVHTVMYFYYFLMAIKMKPKWFNAIWITVFQLVQMVIGVSVSLLSFYYYMTDETCAVSQNTIISAALMYGSYLYLFAAFFVKRYLSKSKKASSDKKTN